MEKKYLDTHAVAVIRYKEHHIKNDYVVVVEIQDFIAVTVTSRVPYIDSKYIIKF